MIHYRLPDQTIIRVDQPCTLGGVQYPPMYFAYSSAAELQALGISVASDYEAPRDVPQSVTAFQVRAALRRAGLRDQAEAAIAAAGGEQADAWEYEPTLQRASQFIAWLTQALDMSPSEMDALFIEAGDIA